MKNGKNHSLNGENVHARRVDFSQNQTAPTPISIRLAEITKDKHIEDAATRRAKLRASLAKAESRKKVADDEAIKARAAIEEGHP